MGILSLFVLNSEAEWMVLFLSQRWGPAWRARDTEIRSSGRVRMRITVMGWGLTESDNRGGWVLVGCPGCVPGGEKLRGGRRGDARARQLHLHFNETRWLTPCQRFRCSPQNLPLLVFARSSPLWPRGSRERAHWVCAARRSSGRKEGARGSCSLCLGPGRRQPSDYVICKVHLNPSQILSVWGGGTQARTDGAEPLCFKIWKCDVSWT